MVLNLVFGGRGTREYVKNMQVVVNRDLIGDGRWVCMGKLELCENWCCVAR